jgi:hypothetical protein
MAASFFAGCFLGKVTVEHAKGREARLSRPGPGALLPHPLIALAEIVILRATPDDERMRVSPLSLSQFGRCAALSRTAMRRRDAAPVDF